MFVEQEYFIGYRDVNINEELTNTGLLAFLENNAGKHSSLVGNNLISDVHTWMLLSWKVKVIKRPKFNDIIRVKTWSRKIEKFYAFRDFEVYDKNNEIIAVASSKWVYLDIEKGKIVKVPEETAASYDSEEIYSFEEGEREFSKLKEPEIFINTISFPITRSMIDSNRHLHNIYYMDMAKEVLPKEIYEQKELNEFEVMYKKEIKYGDIPKVFYSKENDFHIVTIKSNDESEIHAIIKMR